MQRLSWQRSVLMSFVLLCIACLALAGWQYYKLQRAEKFNALIKKPDALTAQHIQGQYREPWLMLALADRLQREGNSNDALAMLRDAEARAMSSTDAPSRQLRNMAKFNSANIYLQQALQFSESGDKAKAIPPAELAKALYREVLRRDAEDWAARYNLERALAIVPELEAADSDASMLPPPGERAVTTMRGVSPGLP